MTAGWRRRALPGALLLLCMIVPSYARRMAVHAEAAPLRVYVLNAGSLGGRSAVIAYLVVHQKGTLMWEAGTIPDALITTGTPASDGQRPELLKKFDARAARTLKSQLAAIGYAPAAITFFSTSHYHFDHIANAADFTASTWLVQRAEREAMFAPGAAPFGAEPSFYAPLRRVRTRLLNGDHDVFGDSSVVIKSAPGHTPGHQVLFLKLARTGPVVLGGDIYHDEAERSRPLETIPAMDTDREQSKATRTAMEAFLSRTGAALWIAHDLNRFKSQKQAPEYYD